MCEMQCLYSISHAIERSAGGALTSIAVGSVAAAFGSGASSLPALANESPRARAWVYIRFVVFSARHLNCQFFFSITGSLNGVRQHETRVCRFRASTGRAGLFDARYTYQLWNFV